MNINWETNFQQFMMLPFRYLKHLPVQHQQNEKRWFLYAVSLIDAWIKSFGLKFTMSRRAVVNKLQNIMTDYDKKLRGHQRYGIAPKWIRHVNSEWCMESVPIKKNNPRLAAGSPIVLTNNDLLDISKNTMELEGDFSTMIRKVHPTLMCLLSVLNFTLRANTLLQH